MTNLMRRGLRLLVDPEPDASEKQTCIAFFNHCCAYCGQKVEKGAGDLDHLVSASTGGRNHISNRVFSCKPCNAKEKRDKPWESFLIEKYGDLDTMKSFRAKITEWMAQSGDVPPLPEPLLAVLRQQGNDLTSAYMEACKKVRVVQQAVQGDSPASGGSAP